MTIEEIERLKKGLELTESVLKFEQDRNKLLVSKNRKLTKQLALCDVVKSLPTEQCVRDWYKEGDIDDNFWKHSTEWSNEDVFKEVYKALKYFIERWQ